MDFQLLNLSDGLITSNKSSSPPSRSMMISLDEQLSTFGNQTFWFSDGISSVGGSLIHQDTRIQLSEMVNPCNMLQSCIEPRVHASNPTSVCSYYSQETNNLEIEVTGASNTQQPIDLSLTEFFERKRISTVNMLLQYMNSTTRGDPLQNSIESCSSDEIETLDPVDVLDMDMPISTASTSTVESTPEKTAIKELEDVTTKSRELVKITEGRNTEDVKFSVNVLNVPSITASLSSTTVPSVPKPKPKASKRERERHESLDNSPTRRLKRPLICDICEKMFVNNSSLKQHMSFHQPQRPYQCEYSGCEKSYKTRSELNRHVIVHIGQKNYKCLKCGKTFLRKQYLKTHLIRHNEGLTWQCSLCAKIFVSEEDLEKHKVSYHKNGKRVSLSAEAISSKFALEYHNEDSLEA